MIHAHHDHSDMRSGTHTYVRMGMHTHGKCHMHNMHAPQLLLCHCNNKAHAIVPIQQCTPIQCKTYRDVRLLNPVHAFEGSTEIWLLYKYLQQNHPITSYQCCAFHIHASSTYSYISYICTIYNILAINNELCATAHIQLNVQRLQQLISLYSAIPGIPHSK